VKDAYALAFLIAVVTSGCTTVSTQQIYYAVSDSDDENYLKKRRGTWAR